MVESGRVAGKGGIPVSIKKLSRRVPKKNRICVSTEKLCNPGEYQEKVESLRVSKNCPSEYRKGSNLCEYRKLVHYGRVPGNYRIDTSIEKLSRGVHEKGRINLSTEK